MPAGSRMFCTAAFDNSENNLANPDPTKTVRWGDQSWEEMMLGYFDVMVPRDDSRKAGERPLRMAIGNGELVRQLDKDRNGKISREEARGNVLLQFAFDRVDENKDGEVEPAELVKALEALRRREGSGE
jgi:hypothetical protein